MTPDDLFNPTLWSTLSKYAALGVLGWLAYKAIEPLMSPLRKLPGMPYTNPLLGNMRYLMSGEAMERSIEMVKRYGPLVRYYFMWGRERLLVADPDVMRHICVTNSRNYIKPPERLQNLIAILGQGLVTSEGMVHHVHKRLMSPAFSTQAISKMIPVFELRTRQLADFWIKALDKQESAIVSIHSDLARTTLDIIGQTAFGYDFDCLVNPDHEVSAAFFRILSGSGLSWLNVLPYANYLPFPSLIRFKRDVKLMKKVVTDVITKKRELIESGQDMETVTGDILGKMMLEQHIDCGGLNDIELQDEVMTLMAAGHETTAVGMAWCLLMLATHQDIQNKARQEILSMTGDSTSPLTYDMVDQLEYCGWVVKETLRYLPPVPLTLRKALEDDTLPGDHFIPAGTILLLSMGPMMRQNEVYSDAETFNPDRFAEPETAENSLYRFAPFLYGRRQCLGYRFALVEMRTMLAVLLPCLRFDLDPQLPVYKRRMLLTMRPTPSLQLRVSRIIP